MGLAAVTKHRRQETDVVREMGSWKVIGSAEEEENWRELYKTKIITHLKIVS